MKQRSTQIISLPGLFCFTQEKKHPEHVICKTSFVKSLWKDPTSVKHIKRFQVMPRCFGINGSRVESVFKSLVGWGNSISMDNFLFFSTGVLKHSRSTSSPRETTRSLKATAGWETGRSLVSKHLAGQGFHDSLSLGIEKKGPQICRDQSVPWVPEPLWPPSAYSNRVSWKKLEPQADLGTQTRQEKEQRWIPENMCTLHTIMSVGKARGRSGRWLLFCQEFKWNIII